VYSERITLRGKPFLAIFDITFADSIFGIEPTPVNIKLCNFAREHLYAVEYLLDTEDWDIIKKQCIEYVHDNLSEIYDG